MSTRSSSLPLRRAGSAATVTLLGSACAMVFVFGATANAAQDSVTVTKLSQAEAASRLSAAGVTHSSSGGCTDRGNPTCTSFSQINATTVAGVITLKKASGCPINITGGTEVGHATSIYSHYNGYKVDTSRNTCLDGYVKGAFTRIGNRKTDGYPQWRAASGNLYCDEGNHWDIVYTSAG
ncbi:MAG: hypothetical protein ACRDQ5_03190 [Sciscionella sp.]